VPFDKRKAIFGVLIAGITGGLLFLPAIYFIGLAIAPPRPIPATAHVSPVVADALWARANGGRGHRAHAHHHVSMAKFAACVASRISTIRHQVTHNASPLQGYMPRCWALNTLTGAHMRDATFSLIRRRSRAVFHHGLDYAFVDEGRLPHTVAERGEFGTGLRGAETASRTICAKGAAELTLPQAALLASFIGESRTPSIPGAAPRGRARTCPAADARHS
jgi:hypothetical protein